MFVENYAKTMSFMTLKILQIVFLALNMEMNLSIVPLVGKQTELLDLKKTHSYFALIAETFLDLKTIDQDVNINGVLMSMKKMSYYVLNARTIIIWLGTQLDVGNNALLPSMFNLKKTSIQRECAEKYVMKMNLMMWKIKNVTNVHLTSKIVNSAQVDLSARNAQMIQFLLLMGLIAHLVKLVNLKIQKVNVNGVLIIFIYVKIVVQV